MQEAKSFFEIYDALGIFNKYFVFLFFSNVYVENIL